MREKRNTYRNLRESQKERDHFEDTHVDGIIMLKWILKK
jgi:hypothetical protein